MVIRIVPMVIRAVPMVLRAVPMGSGRLGIVMAVSFLDCRAAKTASPADY
jgi:hypothetical protein